jgi:hypothetical protein
VFGLAKRTTYLLIGGGSVLGRTSTIFTARRRAKRLLELYPDMRKVLIYKLIEEVGR